jgi:hypothetical protein
MSTWSSQEKTGNTQGWEYNEASLTYDGLLDPISNLPVYYNSMGSSVSYTNLTKH